MPTSAATTSQVRQRAGLDVLTWPAFDPLPVDVAVTTRHGGISPHPWDTLNLSFTVGDDPANVRENRRRVSAALGVSPADFIVARQVHGATARVVSCADRGRGADGARDAIAGTDALVTADPTVVLAVLVADCVPVVLYDPRAHVLACVHAGWRGTVAGVTQAALTAMGSLGAEPARVIAGVGPAIAPDRYQVGPDVAAQVRHCLGAAADQALCPDGPGHWLLDLWAANRLLLTEAGVPAGQIHCAGVATGPQPSPFFSHRARQPCGRFALVARLLGRGGR